MHRNLLLVALLAASAFQALAADRVTYFREGQRIDPQEVASVLARPTRSIRLLPDPAASGTAVTTATPGTTTSAPPATRVTPPPDADQEATALALAVQFAFDSAEILPQAIAQLDALAEGIKLLDERQVVVIEGHTDARGKAGYNLDLSRRRAEAVKLYLVQAHGIQAARLRAQGLGMSQPLADTDPAASRNRRVQFRGA